jgi:hypothetical protein
VKDVATLKDLGAAFEDVLDDGVGAAVASAVREARAGHRTIPPWFVPAASTLLALLRLPAGWNSYAARPINPRAVGAALELLAATMQPDTPIPSVVPMSRGDVQLEWHLRDMDIEVVVPAEGPVRVWYEDLHRGAEREFTLDEGSEPLREVLHELTAR